MRRPCSLCLTTTWPLVHALALDDGIERCVCTSCSERLATFVLDADRELLTLLFHLPSEVEERVLGAGIEEESLRRYAELGLLDDALLEAADALCEIPDREVRAQSLEVIFGLLREDTWPHLKGHLFPV